MKNKMGILVVLLLFAVLQFGCQSEPEFVTVRYEAPEEFVSLAESYYCIPEAGDTSYCNVVVKMTENAESLPLADEFSHAQLIRDDVESIYGYVSGFVFQSESFNVVDIDGKKGTELIYRYDMHGGSTTVRGIDVLVAVDDYIFRISWVDTTEDGRWMDEFRASEQTMNLIWDNEPEAKELNTEKLVVDTGWGVTIQLPEIAEFIGRGERAVIYQIGEAEAMSTYVTFEDMRAGGLDPDGWSAEQILEMLVEEEPHDEPVTDALGNVTAFSLEWDDENQTILSCYSHVYKGEDRFYITEIRFDSDVEQYGLPAQYWISSIGIS